MITVLTEAIATLSHGNEDYHGKILQTTQTLSQISQLEDIRKIRSSLSVEIGLLKDAVKQQQSKERQQQAKLSESVETLQSKLKTAVKRPPAKRRRLDFVNRSKRFGFEPLKVATC